MKNNRIKVEPLHFLHYPWQLEALRTMAEAQYIAMVVARQSGKTELLLWLLMDFCFNYNKFKNPRAFIAGKTSESIFQNIFQRMHNQMSHLPDDVYVKRGTKEGTILVNVYRPEFGDYAQLVFSGVGNIGAVRGGTFDLMLLDEYSLYPTQAWNAVLRPATKVRGAKAIFTGTPEGRNNPLYRETMLCKKRVAAGDPQYANIYLDCYNAGVLSEEEITAERTAYEESGEPHLFHQEYMVRFDAIDVEEAPFNRNVMELENGKSDITDIDKKLMYEKTRLNVTVDIGKKGNCATWFWVESPMDKAPIVIGYEDQWNGIKELLQHCATEHSEYQVIRVTLPHDVMQPSMEEGNTRLDVLHRFINEKGYNQKLRLNVLPKTKDKNQLWQMAIQKFKLLRWDRDGKGVFNGLTKISQVRFKRDAKTGWVKFGDVILDGSQHAADALMYIFADLNENQDLMSRSFKTLSGISMGVMPGVQNYLQNTQGKRYRW